MTISPNESFMIIMGGTALIFGTFVLYAVLHHDKHSVHRKP